MHQTAKSEANAVTQKEGGAVALGLPSAYRFCSNCSCATVVSGSACDCNWHALHEQALFGKVHPAKPKVCHELFNTRDLP